MLAASYPFLDVFWSIAIFFLFFIWIWILFTVFADLFRRRDIGGGMKALWIIFVIVLPYLGVFIYLIAESQNMADRKTVQLQAATRARQEEIMKAAAGSSTAGSSAADQIARAKQLLDSGAISQAEFDTMNKRRLPRAVPFDEAPKALIFIRAATARNTTFARGPTPSRRRVAGRVGRGECGFARSAGSGSSVVEANGERGGAGEPASSSRSGTVRGGRGLAVPKLFPKADHRVPRPRHQDGPPDVSFWLCSVFCDGVSPPNGRTLRGSRCQHPHRR